MKYIIVIRGVLGEEYESIKRDITNQCGVNGFHIPIFVYLPASEPEIEIVWTDAEIHLKHLEMINKL